MTIITTSQELLQFCNNLFSQKPPFVTVDTEFVREKTYWPHLCLIQIGTLEDAVIIDPLATDMDFKPLIDLFKDPTITKVFHSARQDLEIFWHLWKTLPTPLFDTQIAAMVCGVGESLGYEALTLKLLGIQLDKAQQYTNWAHRPLSDKQLEYARADVQHLVIIYEKLRANLTKLGRTPWLEDEQAILTTAETYQINPWDAWKRIKIRTKNPRVLATLQDSAAWREDLAQSHNLSRRRILTDEVLIQLAAAPPNKIEELNERFPMLAPDYLKSLFDIFQKSAQRSSGTWPVIPHTKPLSEDQKKKLDHLKEALANTAEELGVPARLIAKKDDLEELALTNFTSGRLLSGWRFEAFGRKALGVFEVNS